MLKIGDKELKSRLFVGTGKYSSHHLMEKVIESSHTEVVTVALRRVDFDNPVQANILDFVPDNIQLMPNTSGARTADEAIRIARHCRSSLGTNWIKIEVISDNRYLLPDPVETLKASEVLANDGFVVLPYMNADPILAKRLEDVGVAAVMPLGAPIGTSLGVQTLAMLKIIIEMSRVPVVVDAGIGAPSDAALCLELGADAVLVNTAIAVSTDPMKMAKAFRLGVKAGRIAYKSGLSDKFSIAEASSPLTGFLR
ncbi:MAG: thiazole synthase [bacterium]|nr:thiazole synthase [bacterium]